MSPNGRKIHRGGLLNHILRIVRRILPRFGPRTDILKLPGEVLLTIWYKLSPLSQVCLALTCKHFYNRFFSMVSYDTFQLPRGTRYYSIHPALFREQMTQRTLLLVRLQDRHWAYCQNCLKLHPIKEFQNRPEWKHYDPKTRLQRCGQYCSKFGGIVVLCPCLQLSLRDRFHLSNRLPLKVPWHKCSIMNYPSAPIDVQITPTIEDNNLIIYTQYDIQPSPKGPQLYRCPHQEIPWPTSLSTCKFECGFCVTVVEINHINGQIRVQVRRNLGRNEWPGDRLWLAQCEQR